MAVYVMTGGNWRRAVQPAYVMLTDGNWHQCVQGYVMNGGAWKQLWLTPYNNTFSLQINWSVNRDLRVSINYRTGQITSVTDGDGRTHVNSYPQVGLTEVPNIQSYEAWSVSITRVDTNTTTTVTVQQQPNPSNDYTAIIHMDDNPWSNSHDGVTNVYFSASP